ncbi:hypothetical protein H477_4587 [[Clostridium] sordellii ATCC 9714]|nr:hypothetical protein H477_4587 [[Clostridium] sordellii ATCC 9714] [Paeniclostridium sordellii ATCC 9714]
MFCKIRKGKEFYSIYICERYRKDGKVVSKDKKIVSLVGTRFMKMTKNIQD